MSDTAPVRAGWTEHEILVSLINVIEISRVKLDFNSAQYPVGRNANGFSQKIMALKKTLKPEIDAIKAGTPLTSAATTPKKATPKKSATPRKRKSAGVNGDGDGEEATPKKRGRPKKVVETEEEPGDVVKEEVKEEESDLGYLV